MKRNILIRSLIIISIFASIIFSKSCANTSAGPQGGPKDTLPPILTEMIPVYNAVNHPTDKKHNSVTFTFNEYVQLDKPNENIFLSPPQLKPPKAKIKGKKVVISFDEPLDSNQSYSLSLGNAVKDNNEGNFFPPFIHSFSTGDVLDSMFVSGTVQDAFTMMPMSGITILFHTDPSDSAIFNVLPCAAAKSDDWGYFTVRNLPTDTLFRVFAIEDINHNNLYDPESERVAFLDSLVIPSKVMHFDDPELVARDMKDTAACLSRPSEIYLSLFKEYTSKQFLRNRERVSRRQMYVTFSSPNPQIDSIYIEGIPHKKLLFEYNLDRDSIIIWLNEQGPVKDTLKMMIDYMMTDDSLKILVPRSDTIRLARPKPKYEKDRRGEMVEVVDTLCKYDVDATPENIDQNGIIFKFSYPMINAPFDSVKITSIDTKQQEAPASFTVERDSLDIKKYTLRLDENLKDGFEYVLKMPGKMFQDINGLYCDSLEKKISLPKSEDLSSLTLELVNVDEEYMVELLDEKRAKLFRKFNVDTTASLYFPYLKAGKYSIRITQDKNGNGRSDTGDVLKKKQPEKVIMYKANNSIGNKAYILEIPEKTDLIQTLDLALMFK